MSKIIQLSEETINKIAAGEVIERPASVVKELIENAIDAGAKEISISIREGGKSKIEITDDGEGMSPEDARISIERHATSKIKDHHDLFDIKTLGFRGEALSSIAAVSRLTIITRTKDSAVGFKMLVENGKIIKEEEMACNTGTKIIVRDLFFNVPARQKFLKTKLTELKQIVDVITRYSLIKTDLSIRLKDDGNILVDKPVTSSVKENMALIYGVSVAKDAVEIKSEKVNGYFVKPTVNRATKDYISVFLNGRYIRSGIVENALMDALKTLVFHDRYPIAVINISIDPEVVDVNVHPSKRIIKFSNEDEIYELVFDAVKSAVNESDLFTESRSVPKQTFFDSKSSSVSADQPRSSASKSFGSYPGSSHSRQQSKYFSYAKDKQQPLYGETHTETEHVDDRDKPRSKYNIIGQIHKTYIILETEEGYALVDQHALHERILYNKFSKKLANDKIRTQELLSPAEIELSSKEFHQYMELKDELDKFGFEIDEFGTDTIILRKIPADLKTKDLKDALHEFVSAISEKKDPNAAKEQALIYLSCRSAIKAGDSLTYSEMKDLIDELEKNNVLFTCPHGRPTLLNYPMSVLEKDFKRRE